MIFTGIRYMYSVANATGLSLLLCIIYYNIMTGNFFLTGTVVHTRVRVNLGLGLGLGSNLVDFW